MRWRQAKKQYRAPVGRHHRISVRERHFRRMAPLIQARVARILPRYWEEHPLTMEQATHYLRRKARPNGS